MSTLSTLERSAFAALALAIPTATLLAATLVPMHAASPEAQLRLVQAAGFGFGHGLALAALSPLAQRLIAVLALALLLVGVLLFAGSLAAAALLGAPTALAPFGGGLMILGWLLHAYDRLRARW